MSDGFRDEGLARLDDAVRAHVTEGSPPGAAWAVARHGQVHHGAAGDSDRDAIFRISSMTKPVTTVAALVLVEDGVLDLDGPVDGLLPELADRQVLRDPDGPLDDTVPANRPITVRDLLTFRMGIGMDFTRVGRQPVLEAAADLGLGAGPPRPAEPPEPGEWMRRLGTLPLEFQPGERWLYHVSADVLGVLIARAAGEPFETFLTTRVFEPLGMVDTGFWVPPEKLHRLGPCSTPDNEVYDPPDGQWSEPPAFASGGAGLVSTVDDFLAFGRMLLAGGAPLLDTESARQMTTGTVDIPGDTVDWGLGVGIQGDPATPPFSPGTYGWGGGLGTAWGNDPAQGLVGVLLTTQMQSSPQPPPVAETFWAKTYEAVSR
jgi:CubicO group peptidase (beta-lactamase class C family)